MLLADVEENNLVKFLGSFTCESTFDQKGKLQLRFFSCAMRKILHSRTVQQMQMSLLVAREIANYRLVAHSE